MDKIWKIKFGIFKKLEEIIKNNHIKNSVIQAKNIYIHHFESHFLGDFNISENDKIIIGHGVKPHTNHNIIAVKIWFILIELFILKFS
jgi:hypothetical protein